MAASNLTEVIGLTDTKTVNLKKIQYMHVEPLEMAYSLVIARVDNKPTPIPIAEAILIADGILALKEVQDKINLIRDELVGFPPASDEYKQANASFKELMEEDVDVELPVIDGLKLEEVGVKVDIDSIVVLKYHDLITYG